MLYYRAKRDAYDWFNKFSVIEGELLTAKERHRLATYIKDEVFDEVNINKNNTFINFGVRKECSK